MKKLATKRLRVSIFPSRALASLEVLCRPISTYQSLARVDWWTSISFYGSNIARGNWLTDRFFLKPLASLEKISSSISLSKPVASLENFGILVFLQVRSYNKIGNTCVII